MFRRPPPQCTCKSTLSLMLTKITIPYLVKKSGIIKWFNCILQKHNILYKDLHCNLYTKNFQVAAQPPPQLLRNRYFTRYRVLKLRCVLHDNIIFLYMHVDLTSKFLIKMLTKRAPLAINRAPLAIDLLLYHWVAVPATTSKNINH